VIRESGGDRSAVTGGTQVLSDWIRVRITAAQGSTFIDRMIKLVEGAERQKNAQRDRAQHPPGRLTIIFVFATATIPSYAAYAGGTISVIVLVALFVTLIPDHHRRAAVRHRYRRHGPPGTLQRCSPCPVARSKRPRRRPRCLLDKTGTITLGNRQATAFRPMRGVAEQDLADAAQLASLADETPEGRSIVVLAKEKYGIRGRDLAEMQATFIPFSAQTRMSGVEVGNSWVRKGAVDAILAYGHGAFLDRDRSGRGGTGADADAQPRDGARTAGDRRRDRQVGRHPARRRQGRPHARRDPPQGHRQGRQSASASPNCAAWASAPS